ncbi:FAD-dependent oxidoreductase [Rhodococcus artemisiae]|uniref:FAD-dependent oxidoreductase n=1 Tax=Rhodococcus artemisiae TaxID=714159 RepID=A0ABU7LBU1_9NOCA|nr:FAD-dependent oxidoreductase [Rhodococcus artemisiae]MEE2059016.1 FAD-dependent oxidoreductase [Rhodococcus artemisiae]
MQEAQSDDTFDVVVVGFGGSGAAAAIEAHDRGARVLILEKATEETHAPTTALLAGGAMFAGNADSAHVYLSACAGKVVPHDVSRAWAEEAATLRSWIDGLSPSTFRTAEPVPSAEFDDIDGADSIISSAGEARTSDGTWAKGSGAELFAALRHAVEKRGIEVRFGARAHQLTVDNDRVNGVRFRTVGGDEYIQATSVILATGGFEFDDELKRQYLTGGDQVHFYGSQHATGDGLRMAQAVGADLWHMSRMAGRGVGHFVTSEGAVVNTIMLLDLKWLGRADQVGYIITDGNGRRFADESVQAKLGHSFFYEMLYYDAESGTFPRIPSYWIFDSRRFGAGPLSIPRYGASGGGGHSWSDDNVAETDDGWIHVGATVEEVARAAGIGNPSVVADEVERYNKACVGGEQDAFRPSGSDMTPLDQPPYYCVKLWPGGTNTSGGPRRDAHGRVVHVFGHPIPGLFACGENGSIIGERYPGLYAYYSEVLCTGRIAGRNAVHPVK